MLFNSIHFLVFFPCVLLIYFAITRFLSTKYKLTVGNLLLLLASYYFYMCWKAEYALLLFLSTTITFLAAIGVEHSRRKRSKKIYLGASVMLNLAILFFFKYFNFAAESIQTLLSCFGIALKINGLDILLPVGISFYIFQALGYIVDVYRCTTKAEHNFLTYALFVSFFPQLVAGPIERSNNLLQQMKKTRLFNYNQAMEGVRMMVWGYFMKLVLADHCAEYVDVVFNHVAWHNGGSYLLASLIFTFQIYGDFAGYSLIAIGVSKVLGFELMWNFRQPYLATTVTDFWRRWHISLSTWFKDYLYIPLGGNRCSKPKNYRNIFLTFLVSGLWHGANWTFVIWGCLHGILQCLEKALGWQRKNWTGIEQFLHSTLTFIIVAFAWMFFRANNLSDAWAMLVGMTTNIQKPYFLPVPLAYIFIGISSVMLHDYVVEHQCYLHISTSKHGILRYLYLVLMITIILTLGSLTGGKFIYFQF